MYYGQHQKRSIDVTLTILPDKTWQITHRFSVWFYYLSLFSVVLKWQFLLKTSHIKIHIVLVISGSINVFRRSGLKRPAYAPVPGLTSSFPPVQKLLPTALEFPHSELKPIIVPPSTTTQNYFKPIGIPPPSVGSETPLSQPLPTYLPKSVDFSQTFQSAVMDAIPASESVINNNMATNVSLFC